MVAFLERIGLFAGRAEARAAGEIERDIDEELDFHLATCARELERGGLEAGEAFAEARRRFGDVGAVRRSCARIQMGERIMLKWFLIASNVVLVVAVAVLYTSARQSRAMAEEQRAMAMASLERVEVALAAARAAEAVEAGTRAPESARRSLTWGTGEYRTSDGQPANLEAAAQDWELAFLEEPTSWRHAVKVAQALARSKDPQSAEILARIWPSLPVEHREHVFDAFVEGGGHPMALEVLDLGVDDDEHSVRARARLHLQTYAWRDLSFGDGAAEAWMVAWSSKPVEEVIAVHAARWVREVGAALDEHDMPPDDRIGPLLDVADHVRTDVVARAGVDLGALLREARVCDRLEEKVRHCAVSTRERAQVVLGWCAATAPSPR